MRVLVIGGGGREHALAWRLAASPRVERLFVAPGNAGMARESGIELVAIGALELERLADFAEREQIDCTVVGPEAPLVAGIVDLFQERGLPIFGPHRAAAQLEGSKQFAKAFLARHGIPTAAYQSFDQLDAAEDYIRACGAPIVVKADGLAAGKGVVVASSEEQAIEAAREMLGEGRFGEAGASIVVEEMLSGEEASYICLIDGEQVLPLATSQDHKARDDGDTGPNTGGMGAYSPAAVITPELEQRILEQVIHPTVTALAAEGIHYRGFLYTGLMISPQGEPRVLEFNCRLGDPETQPILMRLRSDLIEPIQAALEGRLEQCQLEWDSRPALGVVMASGGYPGNYRKGFPISGIQEEDADSKLFFAGVDEQDGQLITHGGRVLCACALGKSIREAKEHAYQRVARIEWQEAYYRTDIGHRAILR